MKKPNKVADEEAAKVLLADVLDELQITNWNSLLIGDGSGSRWGKPGGFACVRIDKDQLTREVYFGFLNRSTSVISEMMAYLQPLLHLEKEAKAKAKELGSVKVNTVHIITDSLGLAQVGNSLRPPKANQLVWTVLNSVKRFGFKLKWHHVERERIALNRYVDRLSRMARQTGEKSLSLPEIVEHSLGSVEDVNPG